MGGWFAQRFEIGDRAVGAGCPVYVIAEAGVAHFGSEEKALRLVDLAVAARADAVKFQVFDIDALIARELSEWRERLGPRQLPHESFERIAAHCAASGIQFLATAHDEPSLEFLSSLDVAAYKVGSGEVGNWPFLARVASLRKPMIVSVGMYEDEQVSEALGVIAGSGQRNLALLHCVTRYPTPPEEAALGSMGALREVFEGVVGYSDHTRGFHFPLVAVALGASIVEKHITLDYDVPNAQDWKVSCGPADLPTFISQLREIESGLNRRVAGPTATERENMIWATKSLVTKRHIVAGDVLTADDVTAKRPGTGIPPSQLTEVLGRTLTVDLPRDAVLKWEHLS
jgi:N-acetylneuraminate synthase/N,N'-diacetyllegionaminate synthase